MSEENETPGIDPTEATGSAMGSRAQPDAEPATAGTQYWYNVKKRQVEEGRQSDWTDLMGPYGTREEAQQALEKARRRTDAWDREDQKWERG